MAGLGAHEVKTRLASALLDLTASLASVKSGALLQVRALSGGASLAAG
jgi:hypothetical protein